HSPALFSVLFARAGPAFADDPELVERPGAGDLEEKVPGEAGVLEDHLLDLRRKEIHAADDHHVVATRVDAGDAPEGSRRAGQQSGEIARAVADDRQRLLAERGEDELPRLSVRARRSRVRVDDLGIEVILPDVRAVLGFETLTGDAWSDHLGQSVEVHGIDRE